MVDEQSRDESGTFPNLKIVDPGVGEFTLAEWEAHVEQARAAAEEALSRRLEQHGLPAIRRLLQIRFGVDRLKETMDALAGRSPEELEAVMQALLTGAELEEVLA